MIEALSYDDVLLMPKYSEIESRSQVSLLSKLGPNLEFQTPIIASPMDTVSGFEMAKKLSSLGGVAIIHRYNSIEEQCEIIRNVKREGERVGAAIGSTGDFLERAKRLKTAGVDFICIDVAHGHHKMVYDAVKLIREEMPYMHIMAGNVATDEAFEALQAWGVNSIRVGIGGGSICSTRIQTGHGVPNITAIMECAKVATTATLIADGGIKNAGDIVKALAAGADFVMLGSLLAGTHEAPGELIESAVNGVGAKKAYRGMASREAQENWRGKSSAPEGIATVIPYKGPVEPIFNDLVGNIKSGLSYSGATNIGGLQARAEFIKQTSAGQHESSTHILSRT